MATMGRLEVGSLREAWKGEAADFTPLLAQQLDLLGDELGLTLATLGQPEVMIAGGRRIDIVATADDGSEFVVENQYGRGDHDHLTRGLAYAVARRARGLIVVAEQHGDEFRAVAQYLNEMAEQDAERGIAVWLVEAKAIRIEGSAWAPLFSAVVEPNTFTTSVEREKRSGQRPGSSDEALEAFADPAVRSAAQAVVDRWVKAGHRLRLEVGHIVLVARGPATSGLRTVIVLFNDGQVLVPLGSYAGQNSGIPVDALTTDGFRTTANELFGFNGSEKQARTPAGWLVPERVSAVGDFCDVVAKAYADQMAAMG